MQLRATITVVWEVEDLDHYKASSLKEAAEFTQRDLDDGEIDPLDIISWGDSKTVVEAVPE